MKLTYTGWEQKYIELYDPYDSSKGIIRKPKYQVHNFEINDRLLGISGKLFSAPKHEKVYEISIEGLFDNYPYKKEIKKIIDKFIHQIESGNAIYGKIITFEEGVE